jgi:hypothetical protein
MSKLTVVLPFSQDNYFKPLLQQITQSPLTEAVIILNDKPVTLNLLKCDVWQGRALSSGAVLNKLIDRVKTAYILMIRDMREISLAPEALGRFLEVAGSTGAAMVYADYDEVEKTVEDSPVSIYEDRQAHPVNDYQEGSIRDDFDFGPLMLISTAKARRALKKYGAVEAIEHAGLYDLRLKMAVDHTVFHIREPLYGVIKAKAVKRSGEEGHFDYVDPRNETVQKDMEAVCTKHLKRVGAYLTPEFRKKPAARGPYPVEASVIIPVRNRRRTIGEAVASALKQKTNFTYNIIVVDNHSTDGTTEILDDLAARHPSVKHVIPERCDLNIGGCWNEAVFSPCCGRWAVQLDSDDLYSGPDTLQKMVQMFYRGDYAMVIGAYTIVNDHLEEIPPGLVDHREWTDENGRNNALRINGLGAPRAFDTGVLRKTGFLNVGYGEDYAVALRLSRDYKIGRIYENLYLCRRWTGNTDSQLSVVEKNRNDAFKDTIRTLEISARKKLNRGKT